MGQMPRHGRRCVALGRSIAASRTSRAHTHAHFLRSVLCTFTLAEVAIPLIAASPPYQYGPCPESYGVAGCPYATAYVHASGDWTMITYVWMGFAALLIALVGVIAAAAAYWTGNANLSRTLSVALLVPYAIGVVLSGSALSIMSLWSPTHTTNALVRCHSKQEWGGCALSNAPKKVRRH